MPCCSAGEELLQREEQQQRLEEELLRKEVWLGQRREELDKTAEQQHQATEVTIHCLFRKDARSYSDAHVRVCRSSAERGRSLSTSPQLAGGPG